MYDAAFSTEPCATLAYSELEVYSEPCQISWRTYGEFYGEFYSEPYVTLAYLKPWHIQNPRHIHNTFCQTSKPCVTLTYSESKFIHNSGKF